MCKDITDYIDKTRESCPKSCSLYLDFSRDCTLYGYNSQNVKNNFLFIVQGVFNSISFATKNVKGTSRRLSPVFFFQSLLYLHPVVFYQRTSFINFLYM